MFPPHLGDIYIFDTHIGFHWLGTFYILLQGSQTTWARVPRYIYIYIYIYAHIYIYISALPLVNSWSTSVLTPYLFFLYLYIYIYIYNPCLEGLCKYKRSESQSLLTKANLSDPCVLPWYTFYIIRYITH